MDFSNPVQVSVVVLLTGMVITSVMLIILTFLIKIYGTIVYNAQNKNKQEPTKEEPSQAPAAAPVAAAVTAAVPVSAPAVEGGIPQEVIAAIAAAVYTTTGGTQVVKVSDVRQAPFRLVPYGRQPDCLKAPVLSKRAFKNSLQTNIKQKEGRLWIF